MENWNDRPTIKPKKREGTEEIWELLTSVCDPEIPVLTILDLGVVRDVEKISDPLNPGSDKWIITITPTYSGCPAMDMISRQIKMTLLEHGYKNIQLTTALSPAWTTDWMTEKSKQKLKDYGIAPPVGRHFNRQSLENLTVACPHCNSKNTRLASEFSSTACKALFICNDCREPFDHFKCH